MERKCRILRPGNGSGSVQKIIPAVVERLAERYIEERDKKEKHLPIYSELENAS